MEMKCHQNDDTTRDTGGMVEEEVREKQGRTRKGKRERKRESEKEREKVRQRYCLISGSFNLEQIKILIECLSKQEP